MESGQKRKVREVIVVEGRYDKNAVAQVVDCAIIETSGFGIFNDSEKLALMRKLAQKHGLIILTDSDRAGFFIRGRLRGMLDNENIKHAYIPDVEGREHRKSNPSKEGKLGVEAMPPDVLITALEHAGATFEDISPQTGSDEKITKADLFTIGLSGCDGSKQKRRDFLRRLELPERLTANSLLDVLNILYTREEFLSTTQSVSE